MSNNNNLDSEFKLVSHKRQRIKPENQINRNAIVHPVASKYFDLEKAIGRLEIAKQELSTSDVYSSILASLREGLGILHVSIVKEIVCFGLGKIGECTVARYQLALLLCLRELYQAPLYIYDPIFDTNDKAILESLNINLLQSNVEAKYHIKEKHTTLFYLPHCPKQLANNLLWANWGLTLHYCIIIANSFTRIIESNSKRDISENAAYILNASSYLTELAVINSFKYYEIFNDTAIHIFPWENISLVPHDLWQNHIEPNYTDNDVEFIKNNN